MCLNRNDLSNSTTCDDIYNEISTHEKQCISLNTTFFCDLEFTSGKGMVSYMCALVNVILMFYNTLSNDCRSLLTKI